MFGCVYLWSPLQHDAKKLRPHVTQMHMVTDGGEKGTDDMMRRRMARSSSFNGATLGRAWKLSRKHLCSTHRPRFNGATLGRAWKRERGETLLAPLSMLQWGHAR